MKKISIKDVVEFRRKSDRSKRNFAMTLKLGKKRINLEGGGNYWITSISAISNSYKLNDKQPIINKKDELEEKYEAAEYKKTKIMYKRNIDILNRCEGFNLEKWRPSEKMEFKKKYKDYSTLDIEGLQIQVSPNHIFTFENKGIKETGAIWFIAKLGGYKKEELGIFTDILYRYLNFHFSENYDVNPQYCIAVDVCSGTDINYSQLMKEEIPQFLNSTIDEIKELMQ